MHLITLNSSNVVENTNNTRYKYSFPSGITFDQYSSVALISVNLYYSWFNISANYNNNKFSYKWINGTTYNITIPDGNYTISTLSLYIQSIMYANLHYMLDGTTSKNPVYFISLAENSTLYAVQLYCNRIPTASEILSTSTSIYKNYTKPTGATWTQPTVSTARPQFIVSSTNDLRDILGISAGTYPSSVTSTADSYSVTSDYTPQVSPVSSIIMTCSLCNQKMSRPNNILYSFGATSVSFGESIDIAPSQLMFVPINAGNVTEFYVEFKDQDFGQMYIRDSQLIIMLAIKTKSDILLENGIIENN
jgi:hypothetical protein